MTRRFAAFAALFLMVGLLTGCGGGGFPAPNDFVPGEQITVGRGENVYAIAQKHGVSMRGIIALNGLKPPFMIREGQSLVLPSNDPYAAPVPSAAPATGVTAAPLDGGGGTDFYVPPVSDSFASGGGGRTGMAGAGAVSSTPLEPLAPAAPPPPATTSSEPQPLAMPTLPAGKAVSSTVTTPRASAAPPSPLEAATSGAESGPVASVPDFSWPVQGPVISAFGTKDQGLGNDGVNIAAPKGAPVAAALGGIVVYAGDEMKGFGNLVLIRHEGGWVTAYAHLDRMMVARDSVVAKGDMIGTVGKTGGVSSPQLHFETRHDGKPVDPDQVVKKG